MPFEVCKALNLPIAKSPEGITQLDDKPIKVVGMIHNLRIQMASEPRIERDIYVQVVQIPPKYGMPLSRDWSETLNGFWSTCFKHLWLPWRGLPNQIKVQGEPYLKDLITKYNNINQVALAEQDLGVYCLEVTSPSSPHDIAQDSCRPSTPHKPRKSKKESWILRFDGSKSKMGGAGIELQNPKGKRYQASFRLEFPCTCNTAEYEALIQGMKNALARGVENLLVIGDSELMVKHIKG